MGCGFFSRVGRVTTRNAVTQQRAAPHAPPAVAPAAVAPPAVAPPAVAHRGTTAGARRVIAQGVMREINVQMLR